MYQKKKKKHPPPLGNFQLILIRKNDIYYSHNIFFDSLLLSRVSNEINYRDNFVKFCPSLVQDYTDTGNVKRRDNSNIRI